MNKIFAFVAGAVAWALIGPKVKQRLNESQTWADIKAEVKVEQFNEMVDRATQKYAKLQSISQNELQELISDLKKDWQRIKSAWAQ